MKISTAQELLSLFLQIPEFRLSFENAVAESLHEGDPPAPARAFMKGIPLHPQVVAMQKALLAHRGSMVARLPVLVTHPLTVACPIVTERTSRVHWGDAPSQRHEMLRWRRGHAELLPIPRARSSGELLP